MSCDCHKPNGHHEHFCPGDKVESTRIPPRPFLIPTAEEMVQKRAEFQALMNAHTEKMRRDHRKFINQEVIPLLIFIAAAILCLIWLKGDYPWTV